MYRWLLVGALHGLAISWPATSAAQPAVVASTLFHQAVSKMEEGHFSDACPLLEESYRLDAKPGTLFTLANCRDREGKVTSASARYGEYLRAYAQMTAADQQKHAGRTTVSETRIRELEPQLPTLKMAWQGELPADVKIHVDDIELASPTLSQPLPLDPGPHEIVVFRQDQPGETRLITLELGRSTTFDLAGELALLKPIVSASSSAVVSKTVAPAAKSGTNPRKTAGFVTLGVGGAGLVFGSIMGALSVAEKQTVKAHCTGPAGYDCDATGFSAVERMRAYANPSTIGFVAGGVLAAAGVLLVVTAPARSKEKTTAITLRADAAPGGGFVGVEGTF